MQATPKLRKVHNAPTGPDAAKRVIDATIGDVADIVGEKLADTLIEYLEGSIKPLPEYMPRDKTAEFLSVSTAQIDILSRREADPLPYEIVGEVRRYHRPTVREWVRRQRKAVKE